MALRGFPPDHVPMDTLTKKPCIGDRVRIMGFLGEFEVVQIRQNGLMTDLKHLGLPGEAYIETEVLSKELIYLDRPQPTAPANLRASRSTEGTEQPSPSRA
jgi:hypothetical protein